MIREENFRKVEIRKVERVSFTSLILATVVMFFLVSSGSSKQKQFKGVVLDVCNMSGWTCTAPIWDKLDEFEKLTGIKVRLNDFPYDDLVRKEALESAMHTGAFDVLQVDSPAQLANIGPYAVPLDEYIEKTWGLEDWKRDSFEDQIFLSTWEGKIVGVPIIAGAQIIFYRKQLFEDPKEKKAFKAKYGYELQPPRTLGEMRDIANFFTRDTDGDGTTDLWGLVFPGDKIFGTCIIYGQFLAADVELWDNAWRCQWDATHPAKRLTGMEIAKLWYDFVNVDKVTSRGVVGKAHYDVMETYYAGKAAMVMSWLHDWWNQVQWPEVVNKIGETGSALIPSYLGGIRGPSPSLLGVWFWAISMDSDNKDAAWEFIKWVNSDEIAKYMITPQEGIKGSFLPARKSIAKWAAEQGYCPPATVQDSMRIQCREPVPPEIGVAQFEIFGSYVERLLNGDITPEQFVDETAKEINELMEKAGYWK